MNHSMLYSLHDIYLLIRKNSQFVFKVSIGFLVASIIYTFITTQYYESYISIYPENNTLDGISSLMGGGASIIGFDLSQKSNSAFYIPDVVNSKRLKLNIINNKWNTEKFPEPVNLIEYWELNDLSPSFLSKLFGQKNDSNKIAEENAISKFENNLYVFEEESGLFKVRVLMEESKLASDIANYIADFLIQYIGTELKLKSTQYRKFLQNRLIEVESQLKNAESNLTSFRNKNPMAKDTPQLQNLRGQLIRDLEVEQQVYLTLRTQYELARAEELKEQPVINILDKAYPGQHPYWPKSILIYILSLFAGFMVSIIFLSSREVLKSRL